MNIDVKNIKEISCEARERKTKMCLVEIYKQIKNKAELGFQSLILVFNSDINKIPKKTIWL